MKDFTPVWKDLTNNKKATFNNFIERAIFIGMRASEDLEEQIKIAQIVLEKGLTPVTKPSKLANGRTPYGILDDWYTGPSISEPLGDSSLLEPDERDTFREIWKGMKEQRGRLGVHYSFIFLYGNLIPEQRCIQMAHAAMKMGQQLTEEAAWPLGVNSNNLHYAMVPGSEYWQDDAEKLDAAGIKYVVFSDHDYTFGPDGELVESLGTSVKAIMTYPIHHSRRRALQEYELYRFEQSTNN